MIGTFVGLLAATAGPMPGAMPEAPDHSWVVPSMVEAQFGVANRAPHRALDPSVVRLETILSRKVFDRGEPIIVTSRVHYSGEGSFQLRPPRLLDVPIGFELFDTDGNRKPDLLRPVKQFVMPGGLVGSNIAIPTGEFRDVTQLLQEHVQPLEPGLYWLRSWMPHDLWEAWDGQPDDERVAAEPLLFRVLDDESTMTQTEIAELFDAHRILRTPTLALGLRQDWRSIPRLVNVTLSQEPADENLSANFALAMMNDRERVRRHLLGAAVRKARMNKGYFAISEIVTFADPSWYPEIAALLNHPSERVREMAVEVAKHLCLPELVDYYAAVPPERRDPEWSRDVAYAVTTSSGVSGAGFVDASDEFQNRLLEVLIEWLEVSGDLPENLNPERYGTSRRDFALSALAGAYGGLGLVTYYPRAPQHHRVELLRQGANSFRHPATQRIVREPHSGIVREMMREELARVTDPELRAQVIRMLAPWESGESLGPVREALNDPHGGVRAAAAVTLIRWGDVDSAEQCAEILLPHFLQHADHHFDFRLCNMFIWQNALPRDTETGAPADTSDYRRAPDLVEEHLRLTIRAIAAQYAGAPLPFPPEPIRRPQPEDWAGLYCPEHPGALRHLSTPPGSYRAAMGWCPVLGCDEFLIEEPPPPPRPFLPVGAVPIGRSSPFAAPITSNPFANPGNPSGPAPQPERAEGSDPP